MFDWTQILRCTINPQQHFAKFLRFLFKKIFPVPLNHICQKKLGYSACKPKSFRPTAIVISGGLGGPSNKELDFFGDNFNGEHGLQSKNARVKISLEFDFAY